MNVGKIRTVFVVLTAAAALAGCSATQMATTPPVVGEASQSPDPTPSQSVSAAPDPSPAPTVASNLPAGIRTDGFYMENAASGYDHVFQFDDDGTVSGLFTVVSASDLAQNQPGSGNLRKYWLNSRASSQPGSQEVGPVVPGVTQKPLEADGTAGYQDSQGPVTFKILSVSPDTIRISETYGGGVLTSDWTFTAY